MARDFDENTKMVGIRFTNYGEVETHAIHVFPSDMEPEEILRRFIAALFNVSLDLEMSEEEIVEILHEVFVVGREMQEGGEITIGEVIEGNDTLH